MVNMDGHSGSKASTTFLHHLRDLWKSPRGTVVRIEFLAGVAIIITFLLASFGSSRRWSNRWIVQKGFFAAHALSLSLGTYSIGLMQTSPVKSKMFPIWTVCLFALFGCIDPVTSYNGLEYKGPLSKIVYEIFLHCGYVLLMNNSAITSDTSNTAINVLAVITFIKSFHRSLALVQQSRMRKRVQDLEGQYGDETGLKTGTEDMAVDFTPWYDPDDEERERPRICIKHVDAGLSDHKNELWYQSCYNACIAFSLSHKLQWHFLGLGHPSWRHSESSFEIDYEWALEVIEIELAFLYDTFFTGYPFLHYYQAKTASFWTLASFSGICFVGVAAVTPGTVTSRRTSVSPGGCTNIVDTTALDLIFTFVILVSIALLQLMHLIQGWTSNWSRCSVAWSYGMKYLEEFKFNRKRPFWWPWWMRLKASVATSTYLFNKYLWQEKIGQCSILPIAAGTLNGRRWILCKCDVYQLYLRLLIKMLGFHYVWKVLWDLLGNDTNKGATVRLDKDVKESITQFLREIKTDRLDGNWLHLPDEHPLTRFYLPYFHDSPLIYMRGESHCYRYTRCVMVWHAATWYCEKVEQERNEQQEAPTRQRARHQNRARNRHVANVLSKYCIYLVVSAPELLPGLATETRFTMDSFVKKVMARQAMSLNRDPDTRYDRGMEIANHLLGDDPRLPNVTRRSDPWETLALVWVRLLVYAAPYGNTEAHMRHLAQGGEFITHLWALLYHLDICQWKLREEKVQNITTISHARRIFTEVDLAVVAFFGFEINGRYCDEFVTASRLVDGVRFYLVSDPEVAHYLGVPPYKLDATNVLFLSKADKRPTFFDTSVHGWYGPYNVARFVYTKLASSKARAQEAGPSTSHNPIPIDNQGSEDEHTVVEIKEEVQPPPPS